MKKYSRKDYAEWLKAWGTVFYTDPRPVAQAYYKGCYDAHYRLLGKPMKFGDTSNAISIMRQIAYECDIETRPMPLNMKKSAACFREVVDLLKQPVQAKLL